MNPLLIHGLCLVIVVGDLAARAIRLRMYLRGLGAGLPFGAALTATAWGDAAAGLTPLRFGGEAAKFAGIVRAGIGPRLAVAALGLEAAITYPLAALFGGLLAWQFAPTWWAQSAPLVASAVRNGWPWLVAVLCLTLAAGWLALRWRRFLPDAVAADRPRTRDALRRLPGGPIVLGVVLSLANIVGRTAILPLLALTLPEHPPFGVMLLGSFALLYSQLILPMPAGAGAVDIGFLAGLAGDLTAGGAGLLVAWRFYTVGLGAAVGLLLAGRALGWAAVRKLLSPLRRPAPATENERS